MGGGWSSSSSSRAAAVPATAAAGAGSSSSRRQARARAASVARARRAASRVPWAWPVAGRVHVRVHAAIGTSAQPCSPRACRLPARPSSRAACSIRR
eukprot:3624824-Prymnesium_polylepis.1